jgi:peptide/nickel transport system ATP-binding protein
VVALAMAAQPRLVIADEPTTALDVSTQAQVLNTLGRLCREHGVALLLITHDLAVVAERCDRIAVMYAGRVVETGPVDDVIDAPMHPYSQGLIASVPTLQGARERLAQIDGAMPLGDTLPGGCAFHPRCPQRLPRCSAERPPSFERSRRRVACWLHEAPLAQESAAR